MSCPGTLARRLRRLLEPGFDISDAIQGVLDVDQQWLVNLVALDNALVLAMATLSNTHLVVIAAVELVGDDLLIGEPLLVWMPLHRPVAVRADEEVQASEQPGWPFTTCSTIWQSFRRCSAERLCFLHRDDRLPVAVDNRTVVELPLARIGQEPLAGCHPSQGGGRQLWKLL